MNIEKVKVIAIDADDTLWDNQTYYNNAEDNFLDNMAEYGSREYLSGELFKTESENMRLLGYGAKAVCISMMEAAMRLSDYQISATKLSSILKGVKYLLIMPVIPLPGVEKTLEVLQNSHKYKLILLTKGDMLDQQNKVNRSGLGHFFDKVVIVSTKGQKEYLDLLQEENIEPDEFLMIGNSFRSDIKPVLEIGSLGVHIPFYTTWAHEVIEEFPHPNCVKLPDFESILEFLKM